MQEKVIKQRQIHKISVKGHYLSCIKSDKLSAEKDQLLRIAYKFYYIFCLAEADLNQYKSQAK